MTEKANYIDYAEAVELHFELMKAWGEIRFGLAFRELFDSALARPRNTATYESADVVHQAASLCFGLIKNHPWAGGNKRTASFLMNEFLSRNGFELTATSKDLIEMSLAVEADRWKVHEIESRLRERVKKIE